MMKQNITLATECEILPDELPTDHRAVRLKLKVPMGSSEGYSNVGVYEDEGDEEGVEYNVGDDESDEEGGDSNDRDDDADYVDDDADEDDYYVVDDGILKIVMDHPSFVMARGVLQPCES